MENISLEEAKIIIALLQQQYNTLNQEYVKAVAQTITQQNTIIELRASINKTNE